MLKVKQQVCERGKVFSLYSQHYAFTVQTQFPRSLLELHLTSMTGQLQNVFADTRLRCCCFSKQFTSHEGQICDVHCTVQVYRLPSALRHKTQHFGNWISLHAMWLQICSDSLFPFLLCISKEEKMVGKKYLCSIISIKIHLICKVLVCSGKSDTEGLRCNYVYVLCIYKHTHTHTQSTWWAVLIKKQKEDVTFTQYNKHRSKKKLPQDH